MRYTAQAIVSYLQTCTPILRIIVCLVVVKEFKALENVIGLTQFLVRRNEV
jgi:hypothetical protein